MRNAIIFLLLLLASACFAQTQFAIAVGGDSTDAGNSIVQTSDSGYVLTGRIYGYGAGSGDILLVKINSSRTVEWSRVIGGAEYEEGFSVIQTSDDGYAVAGKTVSFGAGSNDAFLIKLSPSGSVELSLAIGGAESDVGLSVIQTSDGGYAMAGQTSSFGVGGDLFLAKFSSMGAQEWFRTVGGTSGDNGWSVVQTTDGGYVVAGQTWSFGAGNCDLFLVKLSSSGVLQWARAVGGGGNEYSYSITKTFDEGFAVAGYTESFGAGGKDFFLTKFSSSGALQWARAIGGGSDDEAWCIVQTVDGGFVITGRTKSFGPGIPDAHNCLLIKLSSLGILDFSRVVGGAGGSDFNIGQSVVQTFDAGYAIGGYTESYGINGDFFLVKFDCDGNSCIGEDVTPSIANVIPSIVDVSPDTTSPSPTITFPSLTITGITPTLTEICTGSDIAETIIKPQTFDLSFSPNPFNSAVSISFTCHSRESGNPEGGVLVEVFDINGRMVAEIPANNPVGSRPASTAGNAGVAPTNREYIWQPAESVGSGVYLVRAKIGDDDITKRVVYLK